ncbi:CotH kinase family protein [Sphingobacterium thalpophilum]|uniref:CotH kinase family protein n=1 Tax=Sphingobacterium thalpophilum TaxID=259 RepID=UPI0024A7073F|nr:hypothetical protein [Sphingobacterium thalpophilum]
MKLSCRQLDLAQQNPKGMAQMLKQNSFIKGGFNKVTHEVCYSLAKGVVDYNDAKRLLEIFSEEHGRTYFHFVDMQLIREGDERVGSLFYQHILRDPEIRSLFVKTWNAYRTQKFEELMYFIEVYAAQIRDSQKKDFNVWKIGDNNHALNKAKLKTFLRQRVKVINAYASTL